MNNTNLNNLKALKRCRRLETLLFLLIVFPTVVPLAFSLINVIILSIVFRIVYIVMAFAGLYCKKNLWAIAAPIIAMVNRLMNADDMNIFLYTVSVAVAIGTVINNKTYAYLEQQEGFPYFNERFEKQKVDYDKFNETNPFDAAAEERRKTASDKMDDLF